MLSGEIFLGPPPELLRVGTNSGGGDSPCKCPYRLLAIDCLKEEDLAVTPASPQNVRDSLETKMEVDSSNPALDDFTEMAEDGDWIRQPTDLITIKV